jgi:hypothetical protein
MLYSYKVFLKFNIPVEFYFNSRDIAFTNLTLTGLIYLIIPIKPQLELSFVSKSVLEKRELAKLIPEVTSVFTVSRFN